MSEVLYRATKYMNAEDTLLAREERPKKRDRQEDSRQDQGQKKGRIGDRREERHPKPMEGRFTSFTPLNAPIDQVLMQIKASNKLKPLSDKESCKSSSARREQIHPHKNNTLGGRTSDQDPP